MIVGRKSSRLSRTHGTPRVTRHSAPEGPAAEYAMSDASLKALTNFLSLGLDNYAVDLAPDDRVQAVYKALHNLATKPFPPGDDTAPGSEEGSLLAKLWEYVACASPKKTSSSANSLVYKEAKDLNNFICWARLCQTHREEVAGKKGAASAAEQGMPGSLPSWLGGLELSEDENTECYKVTMKHILETELTPAQRLQSHYQWDLHGTTGPSGKARSLHDVIVRKHLGHKNTAHHIYQHGLPRLFAASAAEHRDLDQLADNPPEVQAALAEAAHWLVTLASAMGWQMALLQSTPQYE